MSLEYSSDTAYDKLNDQTECSACQKNFLNGGIRCNNCGWFRVCYSTLKRAADRPPGFRSPRCEPRIMRLTLRT